MTTGRINQIASGASVPPGRPFECTAPVGRSRSQGFPSTGEGSRFPLGGLIGDHKRSRADQKAPGAPRALRGRVAQLCPSPCSSSVTPGSRTAVIET